MKQATYEVYELLKGDRIKTRAVKGITSYKAPKGYVIDSVSMFSDGHTQIFIKKLDKESL
jgi:hypothetical protein